MGAEDGVIPANFDRASFRKTANWFRDFRVKNDMVGTCHDADAEALYTLCKHFELDPIEVWAALTGDEEEKHSAITDEYGGAFGHIAATVANRLEAEDEARRRPVRVVLDGADWLTDGDALWRADAGAVPLGRRWTESLRDREGKPADDIVSVLPTAYPHALLRREDLDFEQVRVYERPDTRLTAFSGRFAGLLDGSALRQAADVLGAVEATREGIRVGWVMPVRIEEAELRARKPGAGRVL